MCCREADSCTSNKRVKTGAWARGCSCRMSNLKLVWSDTLVELANRRRLDCGLTQNSLNWSLLQEKRLSSMRTRRRRLDSRRSSLRGRRLGRKRTRGRDSDLDGLEGRWTKVWCWDWCWGWC